MNSLELYNLNAVTILDEFCKNHSISPNYKITCECPVFDHFNKMWDHFGILHKCEISFTIANIEIIETYKVLDNKCFTRVKLKESLNRYKNEIKLMAAEKVLLKLKQLGFFKYEQN